MSSQPTNTLRYHPAQRSCAIIGHNFGTSSLPLLNLLIVCADPTSIRNQKGLQIALSLLPKRIFFPLYCGQFPVTMMGMDVDGKGVHKKDYDLILQPLHQILQTSLQYKGILLENCPLAIRSPPNVDKKSESGQLVFHLLRALTRLPLEGYLIMTIPEEKGSEYGKATNWIHSVLDLFKFEQRKVVTHTTRQWGLWQKTANPTEEEVFEKVDLHFV